MALIRNRYGKGRVRVMRIHRVGDRQEVSQLSVKAMIEGDFARAYAHADNSTSVATDTIKNIVNVVARENTGLSTEEFCQVLAKRYLDTYPQIASVAITAHETVGEIVLNAKEVTVHAGAVTTAEGDVIEVEKASRQQPADAGDQQARRSGRPSLTRHSSRPCSYNASIGATMP